MHQSLRILLVEDENVILELLTEFLVDAGFRVASCDSGETARAMLAGDAFDAVITDDQLAGQLTGASLLRFAEAQHPRLGLVLTSGYPHPPENLPDRAVFVPKPYTSAALLSALRRARSG